MDFSNYQSTFSWRYGSKAMRQIWSEHHKYELWRKIWVALAKAEHQAGLVTRAELEDLAKHQNDLVIDRILEIEKETGHDVVAAIREFAEKAKIGGGKIHLGATSMDVTDNAEALRINEALAIIKNKLRLLLDEFCLKVTQYAKVPCLGFTHLQPAEPTTIGYRLASYAQDLWLDTSIIRTIEVMVKGKGIKGAVGTRASFVALLEGSPLTPEELESLVMEKLELDSFTITSQVYPRKLDYLVLSALAGLAGSLAKFAGDLRILQSPTFGEWSEPFGEKQVGSSAMPFKKNPVNSEAVCSLARYVGHLPPIALENAALSHLERTLDDSANRRIIMAEAFLAVDEMLSRTIKIVSGLIVNLERIARNLADYAPFAATEIILLEAVKKGADRQEMHGILRELSLKSWEAVKKRGKNPLARLLSGDDRISTYLSKEEIERFLDVSEHVGDAPERALKLVSEIKSNND